MLSETKHVGSIGELAVQQDLLRRKWDVYTAVGDCTVADIVAIKGKVVRRLQVKTVSDSQRGVVGVEAARTTSRKRVWYGPDDFDYLAVYVVDRNRVAYVPMSEIYHRAMSLRFEPARNGQVKDLHLFSDYETDLAIV